MQRKTDIFRISFDYFLMQLISDALLLSILSKHLLKLASISFYLCMTKKYAFFVFGGFSYNIRSFSCAHIYVMFLPCNAKQKNIPI